MKRRKGRERGFDDGETEGAERFKLAHLQQNVHRPHPAPFFPNSLRRQIETTMIEIATIGVSTGLF